MDDRAVVLGVVSMRVCVSTYPPEGFSATNLLNLDAQACEQVADDGPGLLALKGLGVGGLAESELAEEGAGGGLAYDDEGRWSSSTLTRTWAK